MRTAIVSAFAVLATLSMMPADSAALTIDRLFSAPDLSGPVLRGAKFSPDGTRIAYLRGKDENKDIYDLWAYDIANRAHSRLIDSARLTKPGAALSAEEEARRERQRISSIGGIVEYSFSPDGKQILVPLAGDLYLYALDAAPSRAVRRLTDTEAWETDARFSPQGRYVSFIRDANLVVLDLGTGKETAITTEGGGLISYGVAEFIAQEEMNRDTGYWWSPDEQRIAFTRVDESPVEEVQRFQIFADRVEVVNQRYPATGGKNALVQLFVTTLGAPKDTAPVQVDLGEDEDIYLARVNWFPDSTALAVQRQSRDQKTLTLLRAEAATGKTKTLLEETSDKWVELHDELTFVTDRGAFLWASDRTGYRHLYLYDAEGRLTRPVTSGEWMVVGDERGEPSRAIRGVDRKKGLVYFSSNEASPLERQLYVTSYVRPNVAPTRVTKEAGWHVATLSPDLSVYLDTFSDAEHPPSVAVHTLDGERIDWLVENALDESHPYAPYLANHRPAEFGTLKAADGQTLHYKLITPADMQEGQRYPVIVEVYGGPGVQRVKNQWGNPLHQVLAQSGYVVFALDNRGSGNRGVKFETTIWRAMGTVEVQDQVRGVEFLRTLPYVDGKRIGLWGWSYGGFMTLHGLMQSPDTFAAGVSGAPVTDFRLYDTHYTERYLGTPQANPAAYDQANVMNHAKNLASPLLVMHGMADDNVLFTNSTALFKTLQTLRKQFDAMPYPGGKHGLIRHADMGPHALETIKRYFDENLAATESTAAEAR